MKELIICVAPVPGERQEEKSPGKMDVADEVIRSCQAGASIAHLHVRDDNDLQTTDLTKFKADIKKIRSACPVVFEGSTGGAPEHTLPDRCVSLSVPGIEMGSLNVGSINMYDDVYKNGIEDVRFYSVELKKRRLKPFICIFDLSHLCTIQVLQDEGLLTPPYVFNFVFDVPASLPYQDRYLDFFLKEMPEGTTWFLTRHHAKGAEDFQAALEWGGHIRVGYEDGPFLADGTRAKSNADLVGEVAELAGKVERNVVDPAKARKILGLSHLN
jgi:3-keto-5-aminohexanoate cleavage enzyme